MEHDNILQQMADIIELREDKVFESMREDKHPEYCWNVQPLSSEEGGNKQGTSLGQAIIQECHEGK